MYTLLFVFTFLFGIIIGSFLNVVIYRLNTGKSISRGRSICMTCNRVLRWFELLPVISFLFQCGKCRRCKSSISFQYPLVEIGTGLIFVLVVFHFLPIVLFSPISYLIITLLFLIIFSILMVISVYDIRHKIIPDKLVYLFIAISFLSIFINYTGIGNILVLPSVASIISGPLLALPFAFIWYFSSGRFMGLGDAKLILGIGWMLGLLSGLACLILAFWIGAFVSIIMMLFSSKKINLKTEIPFAPFLIFSTLVTFLFSLDIFSLSKLFNF